MVNNNRIRMMCVGDRMNCVSCCDSAAERRASVFVALALALAPALSRRHTLDSTCAVVASCVVALALEYRRVRPLGASVRPPHAERYAHSHAHRHTRADASHAHVRPALCCMTSTRVHTEDAESRAQRPASGEGRAPHAPRSLAPRSDLALGHASLRCASPLTARVSIVLVCVSASTCVSHSCAGLPAHDRLHSTAALEPPPRPRWRWTIARR
jgi:hypothetical protein